MSKLPCHENFCGSHQKHIEYREIFSLLFNPLGLVNDRKLISQFLRKALWLICPLRSFFQIDNTKMDFRKKFPKNANTKIVLENAKTKIFSLSNLLFKLALRPKKPLDLKLIYPGNALCIKCLILALFFLFKKVNLYFSLYFTFR